MLNLSTTTTKLQLITGSAGDIEVTPSWVDLSTSTFLPTGVGGGTLASITTAATTDIVAAPAASTVRNVKHLSIFNRSGSVSNLCTVDQTDGTNTCAQAQVTLLAGERLVFDECGQWTHYDSNGGVYPAIGNSAIQADMEAGTATDKYVTPQSFNWHPGACKAWVKAGVTGNILASWNITSLTDTGTGVLGITIATDFSSVNYTVNVSVEATATTWAEANGRECHIRSATLAVGTVSVDCVDHTAATLLVKDPTTWHVVMFGDQ